jgi:hypothetical protein
LPTALERPTRTKCALTTILGKVGLFNPFMSTTILLTTVSLQKSGGDGAPAHLQNIRIALVGCEKMSPYIFSILAQESLEQECPFD